MQVNASTKRRNYVALVVDESGSMGHLKTPTIKAVKSMIDTLRDQAKSSGQETFLSIISFANNASLVLKPTDVSKLTSLSIDNYSPDGGTALLDAVGMATDLLSDELTPTGVDTSYLVMAFTDGEENQSRKHTAYSLNQLIAKLQRTDRWSFTFQVPRGYASALVRNFGISSDNVREWDTTEAGMRELAVSNNAGLSAYYDARSKGATNTRSFYAKVKTDLSDLDVKTVKRTLDDVTNNFRLLTVATETRIDQFIGQKTKRPYVTGSAYYQLMKAEKVQPQKGVLLIDKRNDKVYGGDGARDIIGLPDGQHARVTPGNHSDYEIFVQSTSVNRILPRGTKVLVKL